MPSHTRARPRARFGHSECGTVSEFGAVSEFAAASGFGAVSECGTDSEFGAVSKFGAASEFGAASASGGARAAPRGAARSGLDFSLVFGFLLAGWGLAHLLRPCLVA